MDPKAFELCVYCPRLCRHVCPVAVTSGREAATPTAMMTGVWSWLRGEASAASALAHAQLCVRCGACADHCKHHRPVHDLLAEAVRALAAPPRVAPPGDVQGGGDLVAIESDDRRWGRALALYLGRPVGRLATTDALGAALLDHPAALGAHLRALRDRLAGRTLVVTTDECLRVARAAELNVRLLDELVPAAPAEGMAEWAGCGRARRVGTGAGAPHGAGQRDGPGCCGGPLEQAHPETAALVLRETVRDLQDRCRSGQVQTGSAPAALPGHWVRDSRCARRLASAGARVQDPVDWLLALADGAAAAEAPA